jgi:NADH dehydrogenase [ubiquinone] 1 alpha subcomplex assembly factor 5
MSDTNLKTQPHIELFNSLHRRSFVERAKPQFDQHRFLYDWVIQNIYDRLADIKRDFHHRLLSGYFTEDIWDKKLPYAHYLSELTPEILSHHTAQYDCIISLGDLHCANDLPGTLIQLRRALRPDGVLLAAFPGGKTLHQLRTVMSNAETHLYGGASPRVYPYVDIQTMAGLMQRAEFALPVVDSEIITVSYRDMFHLLSDIRGMGENNALTQRQTSFTSSKLFFEANKIYQSQFTDVDGRVEASFEIIFVIGWAPHSSQQKPAKRGSGQVSLTEVLKV